jgi:hypothetical protein
VSPTVLASRLDLGCFLVPVSVKNRPEHCTPSLSPLSTEYYKINEIVSHITREIIITSYKDDYHIELTEADSSGGQKVLCSIPDRYQTKLLSSPQSRMFREIDDHSSAPPPAP